MKSKFVKRILALALVVVMAVSTMAMSVVSASAYVDPDLNNNGIPDCMEPCDPLKDLEKLKDTIICW